jgi:anti-sigma regulatory factor (Ser/Thr protein kinase)
VTATVFGTGILHAVAADEGTVLPDPVPGLVVDEDESGFRARLWASPEAFSAVRALTLAASTAYGIDRGLAESAELVVSELMGNVVRASSNGMPVPLLVDVHAIPPGVEVTVHDTVPDQPHRADVALDSADAVSGRGMGLLDLLTEGWTVEPSPEPSFEKMIRCRLSRAE